MALLLGPMELRRSAICIVIPIEGAVLQLRDVILFTVTNRPRSIVNPGDRCQGQAQHPFLVVCIGGLIN